MYAEFKIVYNNKIIAIVAVDNNGLRQIIIKGNFNKYKYQNIKITSDNRIIGNIQSINRDELPKIYMLHMYHASHSGISFPINPAYSRVACDFGQGFYTGQFESQVKTLVVKDDSTIFYDMYADLNGLNIYKLDNPTDWALYVASNRGRIDYKKYTKLRKLVDHINSQDIVYGPIADDRMNYVFSEFEAGNLTIDVLVKSLRYVKYGNQYAFKTDKACSRIQIVSSSKIEKPEIKQLKRTKSKTIYNLESEIDILIKKNRDIRSKYIDELLKEYK
jgi:hypothetical protein